MTLTILKYLNKYIPILILLNVLLIGVGYLSGSLTEIDLLPGDVAVLSSAFSIIALITLIIFLRGQTKEPESQTLHTLLSLSLKFLLDMILAFIWFIVAKKTSLISVLLYFVIYLTLTLFSLIVILNTLKNKFLLNK